MSESDMSVFVARAESLLTRMGEQLRRIHEEFTERSSQKNCEESALCKTIWQFVRDTHKKTRNLE